MDPHSSERGNTTLTAELEPARLAAALRADQCQRWQQGERITAEAYLEQYPTLRSAVEYAVDLVYCEFLLCEGMGENPQPDEYLRRFPQFAQQLQRQFALHQGLSSTPNATRDGFSRATAATHDETHAPTESARG